MATIDKKRRRRLRRRGRIDLLASADSPILIEGEAIATTIETDVTVEAADGQKPKPPSFRARCYNGGPMTPRVRGYSTGGIPIVVDLAAAKVSRGGRKTPVLYAHDRTDPIGHTTRVDLTDTITAEGVLSVPGPSHDRVAGGAAGGYRWAVSIGFEATELEYLAAKEFATVNGRRVAGPVYIARRGTLHEISLLPIGAEATASATVTATLANPPEPIIMRPELRAFIEAAGFDPNEIDDKQLEFLTAQFEASGDPGAAEADPAPAAPPTPAPAPAAPPAPAPVLEAGADDDVDPIAAQRRAAADERRRVSRITEICAEYANPKIEIEAGRPKADLGAHAIEAGWDADKVELEAMRASRAKAPAAHVRGRETDVTIEAITAGLMERCGIDVEANCFRTRAAIEAGTPDWLRSEASSEVFGRTMDRARRFRGAHLLEIAAAAVELDSGQRPYGKTAIIEAAFSSASLAVIFGTTIGARVLQSFNESVDTTMGWTRRTTVPDFEQHQRIGLNAMASLDYLPPGGEADHAERATKNETVQAARYAKQFAIDEQDLMGDRLNLLASTPQDMGRAAARLIPDLVYHLILSNPTMTRTSRAAFHTTDDTLIESAAFSKANLSAAIASLMKQKDGDATLNFSPTHLVTGTELADDVVQLTGSAIFTNDSGAGARNPLARYGITPVADARMSNGVVHPKTKVLAAGSATDWLLVSTDADGVEVQTVDGTGGIPRVRVTNLTQGKFGMHVDVKHDAGAQIVENRTLRLNRA